MPNIIQYVFEKIPGEFLRVAKKQIMGPMTAEEKNQVQQANQAAAAAKKKLPGLIVNDQKMAQQRISQLRQQILQHGQQKSPGPEIKAAPPKPKVSAAVKMMLNNATQTRERQSSVGG